MLQPRVDAGLLAEIPGEGDDLYLAVAPGIDLFQVVQGGIPAAVIDVDNFQLPVAQGLYSRLVKGDHIFSLVIAGNHQRKLCHRFALHETNLFHYSPGMPLRQGKKVLFPLDKTNPIG